MFSADGVLLAVVGRLGDGPGEFREPRGLAVTRRGVLFVAEFRGQRIQEFSPAYEPLGFWGERGAAPGRFDGPRGIALAADGRLYVCDMGNHRIQCFAPVRE